MVIYNGRRDEGSFCDSDPWKLFILQGDMKSEAVLCEISLSVENLRSRTSFVLLNRQTACIFIWHGCKSAPHTRGFVNSSVESLVANRPSEMKLNSDETCVVTEIEEGSEPDEFWSALKSEDRSLYFTLLKSEHIFDFTPRLFLIDSMSGSMCAKEIICPYFTKQHSCPFPILQSDLKNASQPALFLLDNNHEVFVWQGRLPSDEKENENVTTGSAKLRWNINRRLVMETALQYCQGKNSEEIPKAFAVTIGAEPLSFTNLFPLWEEWDEMEVDGEEDNCKPMFVQEVLSQLSRDRYSLKELQEKSRPPGVDLLRLESYLTDSEFQEVLGMNKDEFYNMPSWKQSKIKKSNGLF